MSMNTPSSLSTSTAAPGSLVRRFREAFDQVEPELAAIPENEIVNVNVDIRDTSVLVLGIEPTLKEFRPQIVKELPHFDIAIYDKVVTYGCAAAHAYASWKLASEPKVPIQEYADELAKMHKLLLADVNNLVTRGMLDGARLKTLNGPTGFKNLSFDVLALCSYLGDNWEKVSEKSSSSPEEINRAAMLAEKVTAALGTREHGTEALSAATDARRRTFTLFLKSYEHARRAVGYLRAEKGDLDKFLPSLYAGRGGSRRSEEEVIVTNPIVPVADPPTDPIVNPAPVPPPGTGLPNEDPFIR